MSLKALESTKDSLINTILFIKISQVIKVGKGLVSKMEKSSCEKCHVMFVLFCFALFHHIWAYASPFKTVPL